MHRRFNPKPIATRWAANGKPEAALLLFAWDGARRALGLPGAVLFFARLGFKYCQMGADAQISQADLASAIKELLHENVPELQRPYCGPFVRGRVDPTHTFCFRCGDRLETEPFKLCECGARRLLTGLFCPHCGREAD